MFNPSVATADSFLVNHSTAYTAAALTSWTEFGIRLALYPSSYNNLPAALVYTGLAMVMVGQTLRSLAMKTAGESFNHLVQTTKKNNHVLITHGVYSILRHPSYVGFYYWSIGTQLLLGNAFHAILYSIVSWRFFHRQIPYDEESLCQYFQDEYHDYVARTWMGIPFLFTKVALPSSPSPLQTQEPPPASPSSSSMSSSPRGETTPRPTAVTTTTRQRRSAAGVSRFVAALFLILVCCVCCVSAQTFRKRKNDHPASRNVVFVNRSGAKVDFHWIDPTTRKLAESHSKGEGTYTNRKRGRLSFGYILSRLMILSHILRVCTPRYRLGCRQSHELFRRT